MTFPGSVATDAQDVFETAKLQTTDATPTVMWSKRVPTSSVLFVKALVVAEKTDGSVQACYELSGVFFRTSSGNATKATPLVDWATPYFETTPALTLNAALSADTTSQTARLTVTGVGSATYNWRATLQVLPG